MFHLKTFKKYDFFFATLKQVTTLISYEIRVVPFVIAELGHNVSKQHPHQNINS